MTPPRVGIGWDQHRLDPGRTLVLGGVRFGESPGLLGHSDGDVLVHAVCDAVLGALGLPDLGRLFPSDDPSLRGADSVGLLRDVALRMAAAGYRLGNLDAVVVAQEPRLAPRLDAMRERLAAALGCAPGSVNVKAKSPEGAGALGRSEAVAAHAVALLLPIEREPGR